MKAREIFKKSSALAVIQWLDYLTPLILVPYLIRALGLHEYGRIAFAQSIGAYFLLLVEFGFSYMAPREVALSKEKNFLQKLYWQIFLSKLIILIVSLVLISILVSTVASMKEARLLIFLSALSLLGNILFPIWYFQVIDKLRFAVALSAAMRALSLVMVIIVVKSPSQTELAAALIFSPLLWSGSIFTAYFLMTGKIQWIKPTLGQALLRIRQSWDAFLAVAASSAYRSANPVMLGILVSPAAVAAYSVCEKIAKSLQELNRPVAQIIFPKLSVYAATNVQEARRLIWKFMAYVSFTGIAALVIVLVGANGILHYFGLRPADVGLALYILAFVPLIGGLNSALGVNSMHAFGHSQIFSRFVILAGLGWAIVCYPLIIKFSLNGAAMAYLFSEVLLFVLLIAFHLRDGKVFGDMRRQSSMDH